MYCTMRMIAAAEGCSIDTVRRRVTEMEASGRYPRAVRRLCGVEVDYEQLKEFCELHRKRRRKDED